MWDLDAIVVDHLWFLPKKAVSSHVTSFLFIFIFFICYVIFKFICIEMSVLLVRTISV